MNSALETLKLLPEYSFSIKDFPEYSDFIVVGEPMGGTWNKSSIALKRNISAIQVGFDLNLLKTDKEYKNIVIRSLKELDYITVGLLGVTGETASDCEPE